jgi:hypothetical protein
MFSPPREEDRRQALLAYQTNLKSHIHQTGNQVSKEAQNIA